MQDIFQAIKQLYLGRSRTSKSPRKPLGSSRRKNTLWTTLAMSQARKQPSLSIGSPFSEGRPTFQAIVVMLSLSNLKIYMGKLSISSQRTLNLVIFMRIEPSLTSPKLFPLLRKAIKTLEALKSTMICLQTTWIRKEILLKAGKLIKIILAP